MGGMHGEKNYMCYVGLRKSVDPTTSNEKGILKSVTSIYALSNEAPP